MNRRTANRDDPQARLSLRVEDTDTYQLVAAARELEAQLLHQQACRLADVRGLLVELYDRDGVAIDDATLDAQAEDVAAQERAERFLGELATRIHPGAELLELAGQLDDHGLGVWREAAASLVEACPPCLLDWRWRVEEEQRAELRGHAHLVRTEAHLGGVLRRYGAASRLRHRGRVAELRAELATCRTLRERSETRLAFMDAKLLVINRTEQARAAWLCDARQVLARGVAAAQILAGRQPQPGSQDQDGGPPGLATRGGSHAAQGGLMTRAKASVRRCTWRDCTQPAAAQVRFELPNLLAGSQRDYCQAHTAQVGAAPGVRVRRWLGPRRATQPALPGLPDAAPAGRSGGRGSKGVMP